MADHDTHDHTGIPGVGGSTDLDAIIAASAGQDIADALSGAAAPDAGNVFATIADVGGGGGSMVWLQRQTATAGTAQLDFTGFISSTYNVYLFTLCDIRLTTTGTYLRMIAGTGGGPTYDTGANYNWAVWRYLTGGGSGGIGQASASEIALMSTIANTANYGMNGDVKLFNPGGSLYKGINGKFNAVDTAASQWIGEEMNAIYISTTAMTAVRFQPNSGNTLAGGFIDVYGMAHT